MMTIQKDDAKAVEMLISEIHFLAQRARRLGLNSPILIRLNQAEEECRKALNVAVQQK